MFGKNKEKKVKEKKPKKEKIKKEKKPKKDKAKKEKVEGEEKKKPKKKLVIVIVIVAVLFITALVLFLLFGLKILDKNKVIEIGYLCSNSEDTFQGEILKAAKEEAVKHNFELIIKDSEEDMELQTAQITELIESKVEGLIVVPVNTSEMEPVTEAANLAEIPIVYLNRNPFGETKTTSAAFYIGPDEKTSGEMQAKKLVTVMPQGGGVAILEGLLSNEGAVKRTEGNENILKKTLNFKILAKEGAGWKRERGEFITSVWIKAYGDELNAILANNDDMALGALDALAKGGREDIVVFGIDATAEGREAVRQGKLSATVFQDPVKQGQGAVKIMAKVLNEEKVKKITRLDTMLITKDNIEAQ